jgi:hypothetical protein
MDVARVTFTAKALDRWPCPATQRRNVTRIKLQALCLRVLQKALETA